VLVLLANAFLLFGDRARPVSVEAAVADFSHGEHMTAPPLPAAGVYVYDTTGSERVDRLSIHRAYPPVTTRTVRASGGACGYREDVTVFREHVEVYEVCHEGADVRDVSFETRLTYYFVTTRTVLRCGRGGTRIAAGMSPGETTSYECSGDGVTATVTVTYGGPGITTVDGLDTPCRAVTLVTVLRGSTTGGARRALCVDERTGLVLTEERSVGVVTRDRFVGRVAYSEQATFRLRSLVPER
jgi:hypothetical protein